jgi:hypothetical protein
MGAPTSVCFLIRDWLWMWMEIDSVKDLSALVTDYVLSILASELDIEARRSRDDEVLFRVCTSCQLAGMHGRALVRGRVPHHKLTVVQHFSQGLLH